MQTGLKEPSISPKKVIYNPNLRKLVKKHWKKFGVVRNTWESIFKNARNLMHRGGLWWQCKKLKRKQVNVFVNL